MGSVRLATFNIRHGRAASGRSVRVDLLAQAVRQLDADILGLQEVDRGQRRSGWADLTAVAAEAMGAREYRFVPALTGTPGAAWVVSTRAGSTPGATFGIALLSRFPVVEWRELALPRLRPSLAVGPARWTRHVVVGEEPRAAVVARIETPLGPVCVANTHLTFVPGSNARQLARICADLAALPDPVVVLGDLNMWGAWPVRISRYRTLAAHPTFPAAAPTRQLDHILLRGELPVASTSAPWLPLSDHRALVVDFAG